MESCFGMKEFKFGEKCEKTRKRCRKFEK